jgi:hypothetical protein
MPPTKAHIMVAFTVTSVRKMMKKVFSLEDQEKNNDPLHMSDTEDGR